MSNGDTKVPQATPNPLERLVLASNSVWGSRYFTSLSRTALTLCTLKWELSIHWNDLFLFLPFPRMLVCTQGSCIWWLYWP